MDKPQNQDSKQQVIIDCDAGVDDALAILVLLAGDSTHRIDVLAITCVAGNTSVQNVCTNVLRILHAAGRLDIPVYCGAHGPLIPHDELYPHDISPYHGEDGFGDLGDSDLPNLCLAKSESAVAFLNQTAASKKGQVSIICLGPLTNIALTLQTYKEFATNIKDIYIMGGNYKGIGNTTSAAEFNFYMDPEAAYVVLKTVKCTPTLLPWEVLLKAEIPLEWRFDVLGSICTASVVLLNRIEKKICERNANKMWNGGDAILAGVVLCPSIVKSSSMVHLSVELHGNLTRGQGVVDHRTSKEPNVRLIKDVDVAQLKRMFLWAVCVKQKLRH